MKKCGDCIHADICKQVNGSWFSPENIAYCKGFKDRTKYVEVVHGRWVHDINNLYGCSVCYGRETMSKKNLKKYCPNCGARMNDA